MLEHNIGNVSLAPAASVAAAILAAIGLYINNRNAERRKARLEYLNDQLKYLYGPLYALSHASGAASESFFGKYANMGNRFFVPGETPSEERMALWTLWIRTVSMPFNERMVDVIINNAHLVGEEDMPLSFLELIAHVQSYRVLIERWKNDDFDEYLPFYKFPQSLQYDVRQRYVDVKRCQARLMLKIDHPSMRLLPNKRTKQTATAAEPAPMGDPRRAGPTDSKHSRVAEGPKRPRAEPATGTEPQS